MSYGTDQVYMFGQTASYIDRILRGAQPADLPVQAPTKYETVLNLKAAKARRSLDCSKKVNHETALKRFWSSLAPDNARNSSLPQIGCA